MSFQSKVRICPICGRHLIITEMKENHRRYCYNCSPMGREGNYAPLFHAMKHQLIIMRGGACEKCGYNKCEDALQFYHRKPREKKFNLSIKSGYREWEDFLEESKKCDLLCLNCHAEEHRRRE